jgi:hypothetical protein
LLDFPEVCTQAGLELSGSNGAPFHAASNVVIVTTSVSARRIASYPAG